MKLTSEMIKEKAKDLGIDVIGIGSIDRYKRTYSMNSKHIFLKQIESLYANPQDIHIEY